MDNKEVALELLKLTSGIKDAEKVSKDFLLILEALDKRDEEYSSSNDHYSHLDN